jgi:hypothetical protein
MVLSLSPGPTSLDHAAEVAAEAQMWRISEDFWDVWNNASGRAFPQSLFGQFAKVAAWAPFTKPGNWPDADMLPIGELRPIPGDGQPRTTRLTPTEQQTLLTLWSMARSPLILGANLTLLDDPTLKLLTNPDVIRIDQTATRSGQVMRSPSSTRAIPRSSSTAASSSMASTTPPTASRTPGPARTSANSSPSPASPSNPTPPPSGC